MTDKELIQERIQELENNIKTRKQSGKTYRSINRCIDELFNKPIGDKTTLRDENDFVNESELREFCNLFSARMRRDFPDTYFKITYPSPKVAFVVRKTETYKETAEKRLEQWKKKLNEIDE